MAVKPLSIGTLQAILKDQGVTTLDDLLKKLEVEAASDPSKPSYNVVEPLASWVIKVFKLDSMA